MNKKTLTNKDIKTAIMAAVNLALVLLMIIFLLVPGVSVAYEHRLLQENLSPVAWFIENKTEAHSYAMPYTAFEGAVKMNILTLPGEFFEAGDIIQESIDAMNSVSGMSNYDSEEMTSLYVARYGCMIIGVLAYGVIASAILALIGAILNLLTPLYGNGEEKKESKSKKLPSIMFFVEFYAMLIIGQIFVFGAVNSLAFGNSTQRYRLLIDGGFHPLGVIIAVIILYIVASKIVDKSKYSETKEAENK